MCFKSRGARPVRERPAQGRISTEATCTLASSVRGAVASFNVCNKVSFAWLVCLSCRANTSPVRW